jgi:AcrR family transcriptional regulator
VTSTRNKPVRPDDAAVLDATLHCVLAVGVRRTTLTDVARRAGVSRMTLYRRWPDLDALVADLMTRELLAVAGDGLGAAATDRATLVDRVVDVLDRLRVHPLIRKIVDVDPDLLLPYLLHRRGRSTDAFLRQLVQAVATAQAGGSVRAGDPAVLGRFLLLTGQAYVLSVAAVAGDMAPEQLTAEVRELIDRYLRP